MAIYDINPAHILRMTDDTGMLQHAKYSLPDREHGYTTDDNARALIMAAMLYRATGDAIYLGLAERYLGFIFYACDNDWFRNFMGYDRQFLELRGSEDCFGRCLWALGTVADMQELPASLRDASRFLIRKALPGCSDLTHLRSWAYALLGLVRCDEPGGREWAGLIAESLLAAYRRHAEPDWNWFEDTVTCCNAVLPWALLAAGRRFGNEALFAAGRDSLDFLIKATFEDAHFSPVGCKGWYTRGGQPALYDQQPVEACETLLCCLAAHKYTGDSAYLKRAEQCNNWFYGNNIAGLSLIDSESGGCCDGLTLTGVNRNQGAESLISSVISRLAYEEYLKGERPCLLIR